MDDVASGLPVEVRLTNAQNELNVDMSLTDGQYICQYRAGSPGFYILEVTSAGRPVGGSPFSIQARGPLHVL